MTKTDYMNALKLALQDLPGDIQEELLWTYEGKFIDGMVAGKSEQEVIAQLPTPALVAIQQKAAIHLRQFKNKVSVGNLARLIVALFGLMIFNLLMLIPALFCFAMLSSAFITALSLYFAGILLTAGGITGVDELHIHDTPYQLVVDHSPATADRQIDKQARVDISASGIQVNGESVAEDEQQTKRLRIAEPVDIQINLGKQLDLYDVFKGISMIIGSVALMMLSMFLTGLSFRGFRQYLRWNFSQLRLTPAT